MKNIKFFQILILVLGLAFYGDALFAQPHGHGGHHGDDGGHNFVDADGDGVCDNFVDEDGDGVCDGCHQRDRVRDGDCDGGHNFVDADGDGVCDNFVDEDGDGVCDGCHQRDQDRDRDGNYGSDNGYHGRSENRHERRNECFELMNNFPNPFFNQTEIQVNVKESGNYNVKVYDHLGRVVAELHNGQLDNGVHGFTFQRQDDNYGMYFYKVESRGNAEFGKMYCDE